MPLISDTWSEPTYSWLNKVANRRDVAVLRETVKRLERSNREQLVLESESQDTFNHLFAQAGSMKRAITAMSNAIDSELLALRTEVHELREESRRARDRESSSSAAATEAVASAQKVLVELASSHRLEAELRTTREELAQLRSDHAELMAKHSQLHELVAAHFGDGQAMDGAGTAGEAGEAGDQLSAPRQAPSSWRADVAARLGALEAAAASAESRKELEDAVRVVSTQVADASDGLERNREAIQHIANMVSANSAEDEVTAAKLNERIDGVSRSVEAARAAQGEQGERYDAEMGTLRQAIQHVANMVSTNSAEDEATAAKLNERIDAVDAIVQQLAPADRME